MSIKDKIMDEVVGLSKEVYTDLAKPTVSQVGKTLEGVTRIALSPLNIMIWGFTQISEYLAEAIPKKLSKVSLEDIKTPPAFIAVPAIEAMRYSAQTAELRNLYENLLANAMDSNTVSDVHPGFVDVIKNITPDEAKLLTVFLRTDSVPYINVKEVIDKIQGSFQTTVYKHSHINEDFDLNLLCPRNIPVYFDNLVRLGILESPSNVMLNSDQYKIIKECSFILKERERIESLDRIFDTEDRFIRPTSFGYEFIMIVVKDR